MVKKEVSSVSNRKLKLMRRGKKKSLLRRVIDYLKSDTYMYAPLLSSQSSDFFSTETVSTSYSGVNASEPIWEKNENFFQKVKNYMVSDQYLYALLVAHQPLFHAAIGTSSPQDKDTIKWKESMKKLAEEIRDPEQRRKSIRIEGLRLGKYPYGGTTIVRHTQLQKERVKQVVQQKCLS